MAAMGGVSGTRFERFLRENRVELNSAFAAAKRHHAGIDADRFTSTLTTLVGPVFEALAADDPIEHEAGPGTRAGRIGASLYRAALDLETHGLFNPMMIRAWRDLLPNVGSLLVAGNEPLVGAMANAMVKLDRSAGARPTQWLTIMERVTPLARDATVWLQAGQVAAWRAGMAAYRDQALDLATTLDDAVLAVVLGLPSDESPPAAKQMISRLRSDPWFDPGSSGGPATASRTAPLRVGGFRGFGGPFLRPPTVRVEDGDVIASDGTGNWQVLADAFGSDLIRLAPASSSSTSSTMPGQAPTRPPKGLDLGPIAEPSSFASAALGLVATSRLSHSVFLLGPSDDER